MQISRRCDTLPTEYFFHISCKSLFQLGHPLGLVVEKPTTVPLSSDHYDEYRKEIEDKVNPKVNFVVVLLPTKMKQRYDTVKKTLAHLPRGIAVRCDQVTCLAVILSFSYSDRLEQH